MKMDSRLAYIPKVLCKDNSGDCSMYVRINDTVFKVKHLSEICEVFKMQEEKPQNTTNDDINMDDMNVDIKDYIFVLSKMLQKGYFVGVSNEIEECNVKNIIKDNLTGYGEITLVLPNEEIDTISKAISNKHTFANIVVADNKEFDRVLMDLKTSEATNKIYESTKAYIKNCF